MGLDFSTTLRQRLSRLRRRSGAATSPSVVPRAKPSSADGRAAATAVEAPTAVDSSSWVEATTIYGPPPWRKITTERGTARVRLLRVPLPPRLRSLAAHSGTLYLDTETLGLGSQPVFLVGVAWVKDAEVLLEHIYARDYGEEAGLLERTRGRWAAAERLITYNGKSYDLPLLRDRMTRHRIRPPRSDDADLLHAARRRWRRDLPDCKLQTIERAVLGRARQGDVPGREIPERYHRAVRTGDDRLLAPVFVHNAIDLLTLVELHPMLEVQGTS